MKKVTKNTTLSEILELPQGEKILKKHGVPCMHCPMAAMEINSLKIGHVADIYNLNIDAILKDLNT